MIFKYHEGEVVALRDAHSFSDLNASMRGEIWALYDIDPPAYDVRFTDSNGEQFDALMYEEELMPIDQNLDSIRCNTTPESVVAEDDQPCK